MQRAFFSGRSASLLNGKNLLKKIRRRGRPDNTHTLQTGLLHVQHVHLLRSVSSPTERVFRRIPLWVMPFLSRINPTGEVPLRFCAFTLRCGFTGRTKRTPNAMPNEASSPRPSRDRTFIVRRLACGLHLSRAVRISYLVAGNIFNLA